MSFPPYLAPWLCGFSPLSAFLRRLETEDNFWSSGIALTMRHGTAPRITRCGDFADWLEVAFAFALFALIYAVSVAVRS